MSSAGSGWGFRLKAWGSGLRFCFLGSGLCAKLKSLMTSLSPGAHLGRLQSRPSKGFRRRAPKRTAGPTQGLGLWVPELLRGIGPKAFREVLPKVPRVQGHSKAASKVDTWIRNRSD